MFLVQIFLICRSLLLTYESDDLEMHRDVLLDSGYSQPLSSRARGSNPDMEGRTKPQSHRVGWNGEGKRGGGRIRRGGGRGRGVASIRWEPERGEQQTLPAITHATNNTLQPPTKTELRNCFGEKVFVRISLKRPPLRPTKKNNTLCSEIKMIRIAPGLG